MLLTEERPCCGCTAIVGGFYSEVALQKREAEGTLRAVHALYPIKECSKFTPFTLRSVPGKYARSYVVSMERVDDKCEHCIATQPFYCTTPNHLKAKVSMAATHCSHARNLPRALLL